MVTRIKIAAITVLLTPLLAVGGAGAHGTDGSESPQTGDPPAQVETQQKVAEARRQAAKATIQERLDKRKSQLNPKPDAAQLQRLGQRCKPAQAVIQKLDARLAADVPGRYHAYQELAGRLARLIGKLEAQGVDTAALSNQRAVLEGKIAAFKIELEAYQQALSDLGGMDCAADPMAFKASLETARASRQGLRQSVAGIREYATGTIKPALAVIRQQLAAKGNPDEDN